MSELISREMEIGMATSGLKRVMEYADWTSRQEEIDAINHELRCGAIIDQSGLETAHDLIEELPSAQSELTEEEWKLVKKLRSFHNGTYAKVLDKLMAFASAQHKIIHCRECRWRNDYGHWLGCPVLNTDDDNYCSFAERRTDG